MQWLRTRLDALADEWEAASRNPFLRLVPTAAAAALRAVLTETLNAAPGIQVQVPLPELPTEGDPT